MTINISTTVSSQGKPEMSKWQAHYISGNEIWPCENQAACCKRIYPRTKPNRPGHSNHWQTEEARLLWCSTSSSA